MYKKSRRKDGFNWVFRTKEWIMRMCSLDTESCQTLQTISWHRNHSRFWISRFHRSAKGMNLKSLFLTFLIEVAVFCPPEKTVLSCEIEFLLNASSFQNKEGVQSSVGIGRDLRSDVEIVKAVQKSRVKVRNAGSFSREERSLPSCSCFQPVRKGRTAVACLLVCLRVYQTTNWRKYGLKQESTLSKWVFVARNGASLSVEVISTSQWEQDRFSLGHDDKCYKRRAVIRMPTTRVETFVDREMCEKVS